MKIIDALVSPKDIFQHSANFESKNYGLLATILALLTLSYVTFYWHLDADFWREQLIAEFSTELSSDEEVAMVSNALENLQPFLGALNGLSEAASLLIKMLFISLILFFVMRITSKTSEIIELNKIFNAVIFSYTPWILIAIGRFCISVVNKNSQIDVDAAEFTSLGQMFADKSSSYYDLFQLINIFDIWVILLIAQFLRLQCHFSFLRSIFTAALPFLIVYLFHFLTV